MPRSQRSDSRSRSRSRSPSRSPSRRKLDSAGGSYSDRDTDYSDESFDSEDDARHKSTGKKNTARNSNLTKKNVNKLYGKKGGKGGNVGGRQSKASKQTGGGNTARENDNVAKRVMSARRLKINELRNQVDSLTAQLKEVQQENKALRRQNILSEKALDKYEYQENDMPSIIQRHNEEVRVLKEQLRKQKEKHSKTEGKLKDSEAEVNKSQRQVKRLRDIVDKKDLGDRDEMSRKMTSMENELEDNRKRVSELERYTANLQKNHKHELGITRARHKEDIKKLQELQENYSKMETTLREKEKELEVRNIYAQRVIKPPHKLNSSVNSVRSTPVSSQRSVPLSPGHERKNVDKRRKEAEPTFIINKSSGSTEKPPKKSLSNEQKAPPKYPAICGPENVVDKKDKASKQDWQPTFLTQTQRDLSPSKKEEPRKSEVDDDDNWMADRESMKRDSERRSNEERRQREEQEEKERRKRQEEEEEQRKRDQDVARLLREEDERRDREEKESREREEKSRRDREDMEDRKRRARDEKDRIANDKAEQERQRQKALLLAKMKEIDDGKSKSDLNNSPSHRKYSFSKPVENLHNGIPSNEEFGSAGSRRRRSQDSDSDGGYKPSFTNDKKGRAKPSFLNGNDSDSSPKHKPKNNAKKTNLMADLFGGDSNSDNKKKDLNEDFLGDFKPSRPNERRRGQEMSGPGLFDINDNDSRPGSGSGLLPRRIKKNPTTLHNRPTINAVDDIDDDLEEVML